MTGTHGLYAGTRMERVEVGDQVEMLVAHSEAAIDYGIAGTRQVCELREHSMAKVVIDGDARGIFTAGELGFLSDEQGSYCYPNGV